MSEREKGIGTPVRMSAALKGRRGEGGGGYINLKLSQKE